MGISIESKDTPLISVVMPVYNAGPFLRESISSILSQTYPHFELIIVDDGSTDGSAGIARKFAERDPRARVITLEHSGLPRPFNAGVDVAQGELIAFMGADDIALPERLAVQLAWMRKTGVEVCGSCVKLFGDRDSIQWFPESHEAIRYELLFRRSLISTTMLFRAEVASGLVFDERMRNYIYEMYTRMALRYRLGNVPQVLVKYRRYPEQVSQRRAVEFESHVRELREPYFHALFPQATSQDCARLTDVADQKCSSNLVDLEQTGEWLVRLTQTPDSYLRQRMADRWRAHCLRSAYLGMGAYRLYLEVEPRFGLSVKMDPRASQLLWFACALRLKRDSRLYATLVAMKNKTLQLYQFFK